MRYDLEDIFSLTDLTEVVVYNDKLSYLHSRFLHDLLLYKDAVCSGDLNIAGMAKLDAFNDLHRLVIELNDEFEFDDVDLLLSVYIPEYMSGWMY